MDKSLLLKILGKKDSVDFGDMVYNLRKISGQLRDTINMNLPIDNDALPETIKNLNDIYAVLKSINENINHAANTAGYTNSRQYLSQFTSGLCSNIICLINSLETLNIKKITYYNNVIIDLILKY
ncbi:hypothetical protein [uncultured Clostridium sp.]|uniref:hypothetical protein n=1 Tax=uncultured Clostridium sp. TaxID=59620 RepID=UPI0025CF77AD|nr:hypothetical protein [uncultured Clostridium sp.]